MVSNSIRGSTYALNVAHMNSGLHRVKLTASGVHTYFSLDTEKGAIRAHQTLLVESEITFEIGSSAGDL